MMRYVSLALILISFLIACVDSNKEQSAIQEGAIKSNTQKEGNPALVIGNIASDNAEQQSSTTDTEKENIKQIPEGKSHYIAINKQKFELHSKVLNVGAIVFNVLMSEYGTVKGTFVVVTNGTESLSALNHTQKITLIAKNTYRLSPKTSYDFSNYYQWLLKSGNFKQVEMEIDYSGKPRPSTEDR